MKKTVFVIEDDSFIGRNIESALTQAGYACVWVKNAMEMDEHLARGVPDLFLLDLVLPGEHGFDVLARLKHNHRTGMIPVVIFSNLGSQEDTDKARELGASAFMVKALFTPREVVKKIKELIG